VFVEGYEDAAVAAFDELTIGDAAGERGFRFERAGELGGPVLDVETLLPPSPLPDFVAAPESKEAESEVVFMGIQQVKAQFTTSLGKEGDGAVVRRELAPSSRPQVALEETKAPLVEWKESYFLRAGAGLPARIERRAALEAKPAGGGGALRLDVSLVLDAKRVETPPKGDAAKLAALEEALRAALAEFRALADAGAIAKKVDALAKLADGTVFEMPAKALRGKLEAYRAGGIGKQAPDFTLESLDGKQVSFREATKGKTTILSFWGVNCVACCTDKVKLKHLILLTGGKVASDLYSVEGYPSSIWIDAQGRVLAREVDFSADTVPLLERRIQTMLGTK
jgi:hypothetical protein